MGYLSNAAKGLKMMFWAQIVSIFAVTLSAIPLIGVIGSAATTLCSVITIIGVYVAGKDDTLWKIAKRFKTSVESVAKLNQLEDKEISESRKLLIIR